MRTRTFIAAVLLALEVFVVSTKAGGPAWLVLVCALHLSACLAVQLWLQPVEQGRRLRMQWQWLATIGVDLLVFALLRLIDATPQLNFSALLVLPVLMAGVLTPRLSALATAAVATLVLLGGVWLVLPDHADFLLQLSQAGLAGAGLFLVSLLASELSQRLAGQEEIAQRNQALARQQTQLNSVVIEEMADGVLVVDRSGKAGERNPAAAALLQYLKSPPARAVITAYGYR